MYFVKRKVPGAHRSYHVRYLYELFLIFEGARMSLRGKLVKLTVRTKQIMGFALIYIWLMQYKDLVIPAVK